MICNIFIFILPVTSTLPKDEKQNPSMLGMIRQTPITKCKQPMTDVTRETTTYRNSTII